MISFDGFLNLQKVKDLCRELLHLIQMHNELLNCHMVDFITQDHWSSMVIKELKREADLLSSEDPVEDVIYRIIWGNTITSGNYPAFNEFVRIVTNVHLDTVAIKICRHEEQQQKSPLDDWWMNQKKNHEVHVFSNLISSVTTQSNTQTVIDFGCGKGYLSTLLSIHHKLKVLGFDCSDLNTHNAQSRHDKLLSSYVKVSKKQDEQLSHSSSPCDTGRFIPVTKCITVETDLCSVLHGCMDPEDLQNVVLCGLHTCGDLGSTILKHFVSESNARALCYVGCCYHLIQEEFSENPFSEESKDTMGNVSWGFPLSQFFKDQKASLGRNARMLSSQSWQRMTHLRSSNQNKALFYRAALQAILRDFGFAPQAGKRVGKLALKCKNFIQYFRRAAERLDFNHITVSDEEILKLYDKYKDYETKLNVFQGLRVILAPVVEAAVIMDRILFLLENDGVKSCHLVKVFDPAISPRCYAIVALKHDR